MKVLLLPKGVLVAFLMPSCGGKLYSFLQGPVPSYDHQAMMSCSDLCSTIGGQCDGKKFHELSGAGLMALLGMMSSSSCGSGPTVRTAGNPNPHINGGICEALESDENSPVPECDSLAPTSDYRMPLCLCSHPDGFQHCPDGYTLVNENCYQVLQLVSTPDKSRFLMTSVQCYNSVWGNSLHAKSNADVKELISVARTMEVSKSFVLTNHPVTNSHFMTRDRTGRLDETDLYLNPSDRTPPTDGTRLFVDPSGKLQVVSASNVDVPNLEEYLCEGMSRLSFEIEPMKSDFARVGNRGELLALNPRQILGNRTATSFLDCSIACHRESLCLGLNWDPPSLCQLLYTSAALDAAWRRLGDQWRAGSSTEAGHFERLFDNPPKCINCG